MVTLQKVEEFWGVRGLWTGRRKRRAQSHASDNAGLCYWSSAFFWHGEEGQSRSPTVAVGSSWSLSLWPGNLQTEKETRAVSSTDYLRKIHHMRSLFHNEPKTKLASLTKRWLMTIEEIEDKLLYINNINKTRSFRRKSNCNCYFQVWIVCT